MENDYSIYSENGLFGALNNMNEVVIKAQYKEMSYFSCGLARVRNEKGEYGFVDVKNELIIPFGEFKWCENFICGYARAIIRTGSSSKDIKWGIIDTLGCAVVPFEYDNIESFDEDYADNIKAIKDKKEVTINLAKYADKHDTFSGLNYIKIYSINEFKKLFNCSSIKFCYSEKHNVYYIRYGFNMGFVAGEIDGNGMPKDPVVAIVSNSSGKIYTLLISRNDVGKYYLPLAYKDLPSVPF